MQGFHDDIPDPQRRGRSSGRPRASTGEPATLAAHYDERSIAGRFLSGDSEAYRQVMRWISGVLALPRFRGLRNDGPDLRQEILSSVLESLRRKRFNPTKDFRVYIQSIAHYICRAMLLGRVRQHHHAPTARREAITPAVAEELTIHSQQIRDLMGQLPRHCREILTMFYYRQLSYAEIAESLGVPVGTVKSRLFRCVRKASQLASHDPGGVRHRGH